jgi:hypothetical protein
MNAYWAKENSDWVDHQKVKELCISLDIPIPDETIDYLVEWSRYHTTSFISDKDIAWNGEEEEDIKIDIRKLPAEATHILVTK